MSGTVGLQHWLAGPMATSTAVADVGFPAQMRTISGLREQFLTSDISAPAADLSVPVTATWRVLLVLGVR